MPTGDTKPFAERTYQTEGGGGIRVLLFEPEEDVAGHWTALLKIEWPTGSITRICGAGVDKLQAFLNAVALVRINLTSPDARNIDGVTWLDESDLGLDVYIPPEEAAD